MRLPARFALAALTLAACTRGTPPPSDVPSAAAAFPPPAAGPVPRVVARGSVYALDARWRDQRGRERSLAALRGRPQVVAMVYTHCATACPLTVTALKRVEAATPPGVGFVLVSLDPDRDTPGRLAEFARTHALDPARWTLLRGTDADVRALAALLGVRYRPEGAGDIAHSTLVTVLDADGEVAYQGRGLNPAPMVTQAALALAR